jgi:hypothetical protein
MSDPRMTTVQVAEGASVIDNGRTLRRGEVLDVPMHKLLAATRRPSRGKRGHERDRVDHLVGGSSYCQILRRFVAPMITAGSLCPVQPSSEGQGMARSSHSGRAVGHLRPVADESDPTYGCTSERCEQSCTAKSCTCQPCSCKTCQEQTRTAARARVARHKLADLP